ncbi:MAG: hypothetical protein Q7S57_03920 [bacterium]|nr:hypothetical protein [bacterium]
MKPKTLSLLIKPTKKYAPHENPVAGRDFLKKSGGSGIRPLAQRAPADVAGELPHRRAVVVVFPPIRVANRGEISFCVVLRRSAFGRFGRM